MGETLRKKYNRMDLAMLRARKKTQTKPLSMEEKSFVWRWKFIANKFVYLLAASFTRSFGWKLFRWRKTKIAFAQSNYNLFPHRNVCTQTICASGA